MADFGLTEDDLGAPGARRVVDDLDNYLESKGVRMLFTELAEVLLQSCPSNPVG
jgi:hypothetical protein